MAYVKGSVFERFLRKIDASTGKEWNGTPCWIWTSAKNPNGYGMLSVRLKSQLAHRVSFSLFHGEHQHGLELDHLCRNRDCVNADHMEPVTHRENCLRGAAPKIDRKINCAKSKITHCPRGHEYTTGNTLTHRHPNRADSRECRECNRVSCATRKAWKK